MTTAVVGIASSPWYRRGAAPVGELDLTVRTIRDACVDAGIDVRTIDGFVSYGPDANEGSKLAPTLGIDELRLSSVIWGGGGGGLAGALALAKAAIEDGQASRVAVLRTSAERGSGRLSKAVSKSHMGVHYRAHGVVAPAQLSALRAQRLIEFDGVPRSAMAAVALADYAHASRNPFAVGASADLDKERYLASRWISEPYRLFDCSRENDGCGVLIVAAAADAAGMRQPPAYLRAALHGAPVGWGATAENDRDYSSAGYRRMASRLWERTGLGPADIDVVQVYENFTGAAVASLIDFGFCTPQTAGAVLTPENLTAPHGGLPINTAGGNLAEGFVHGIGLALEAVRQVRGVSVNQVPDVRYSLLIGGPHAPLGSCALLASEAGAAG